MKVINILNDLSVEQLKRLAVLTKPTCELKSGIKSSLVALYLPWVIIGILNGFSEVYAYISIVIFIITALFRWRSKSGAFDITFTILYGGTYYLLLMTSEILPQSVFLLLLTDILFIIGVRFMKLSLFKSLVEQKVTQRKNALSSKENYIAITLSVVLTILIGDTLANMLLIFFSYFIAIIATANIFNPYFYNEQTRILSSIKQV